MKWAIAISVCGVLVLSLFLAVPLKWGVWLPDVFGPKAVVLDEIIAPTDGHLRLTQLWVGDGYATEFFHTDNSGQVWTFAIDGDAEKAWRGELRKTNHVLSIRVLKAQLFYDLQSHIVTRCDGTQQKAEKIPRGTPIVPPR